VERRLRGRASPAGSDSNRKKSPRILLFPRTCSGSSGKPWTDVARHAEASRVDVSLQEKDNTLILRVRDNGIGISDEQIRGSESFGLIGRRAQNLRQS
jgi:glucose-6-phosphate-specific signal transduction histidine kinase